MAKVAGALMIMMSFSTTVTAFTSHVVGHSRPRMMGHPSVSRQLFFKTFESSQSLSSMVLRSQSLTTTTDIALNDTDPSTTSVNGNNPLPTTTNQTYDSTNINSTTSSSSSSKNNKRGGKNKRSVKYDDPPGPSEFPDWAYEPRDFFRFEILHESKKSQARVGRIHTPHGTIDTPSFVAVATNAALKGVDFRQADAANQELIFCNTYHLLLQPGSEIIKKAGGLHKFTKRENGPFITDSGGFQVFSLAYGSVAEELSSKGELKRASQNSKYKNKSMSGNDAVKVTEEGVTFRSYRDGSKFLLTPESTVQAQKDIGADIIIPLDELPPYHISEDKLAESVDRSHRWEARSLKEHLKNVQEQAMYCVVHGGVDVEQRTKSVNYLTSLPFDGYAIGGSLGSSRDELKDLLSWMMPLFDEKEDRIKNKPRHLLGIADEVNIRNAVPMGLDTMDSCYPTRLSRHGTLLTKEGKIHITQGKHKDSFNVPIDEGCQCSTCQTYDRAYLHHLFKAQEPLATMLGTVHNIHFMNEMMKQIRQDILDDKI